MMWHVLDANSIWIKEFASSLSGMAPTLGWVREMSWMGWFQTELEDEVLADPPVHLCHFPLQRGYTQIPFAWLNGLERLRAAMLEKVPDRPEESPLICTTPYYTSIAERWPGPVVYYITDLTRAYAGADSGLVSGLERRICTVAKLVCPNSQRIAEFLQHDAGCPASKIVVVPNATRSINIFAAPPEGPAPLPSDVAHLSRPIAGVIGNLAGNMDWLLLRKSIDQNPGVSWVFVGPTDEPAPNSAQQAAREELRSRGASIVFTGAKPYGELRDYARCFDVALLPYQPRSEPTYSGSSTRFYEHLAACRPMLATRGFEELLHKEPLLHLVDSAEEVTKWLAELRRSNFCDGREVERWKASQQGTWDTRAATLKSALEERVAGGRV